MEMPLYAKLIAQQDRLSFHMPGHGGKLPQGWLSHGLDTTELPETDDLYAPESCIREAQEAYAQAVGAQSTLFLTNGSTAGILTMLMTFLSPGDSLILPRNAHVSALHGCILHDLQVVSVYPTWQQGIPWIEETDVLEAISSHPEAKAVFVTRPDYYGRCIPLERIAKAAKARGMALLVDEAHGAHFPFVEGPSSAGQLGADAWVQSLHKTLPAMGGSAVLNLQGKAEKARARLRWTQSSSPSFYLMCGMDKARAYMQTQGPAAFAFIRENLEALRKDFQDAHAAWRQEGILCDPNRLVLDVSSMGGGYKVLRALAAQQMDVEMADHRNIVCIPSVFHEQRDYRTLHQGLRQMEHQQETGAQPWTSISPQYGKGVYALRKAALSETESVRLEESDGRISAVCAGLYPPGIPWLLPGERISQAIIQALLEAKQRGAGFFGIEETGISVMKEGQGV